LLRLARNDVFTQTEPSLALGTRLNASFDFETKRYYERAGNSSKKTDQKGIESPARRSDGSGRVCFNH